MVPSGLAPSRTENLAKNGPAGMILVFARASVYTILTYNESCDSGRSRLRNDKWQGKQLLPECWIDKVRHSNLHGRQDRWIATVGWRSALVIVPPSKKGVGADMKARPQEFRLHDLQSHKLGVLAAVEIPAEEPYVDRRKAVTDYDWPRHRNRNREDLSNGSG
jgi:hypothetical protein